MAPDPSGAAGTLVAVSRPLRVRFAPSPTGFLHVGSAHSALANWLVARRTGGEFLLRIEDTDAERNRPELVDNVLGMLQWLGLQWDGTPVHQSDRGTLYADAAAKLVADGRVYFCDCTTIDVQARNKAAGGKPGYDGFCRDRGLEAGPGRAARFRTPRDGRTGWTDLVRGEVSFANADLEDFVVLRGNGTPVFLLANAFDDADMGITHVIRGEDHVNSTPKYLLLGEAMGLPRPDAFAHMPLLVNEGRKKLSKRRDDVSVADYRDRGYLPEALVNYLALLGWGPADGTEVRPISEIVELYRLEDVNASPAFFDQKKLSFVNAEYIRALTPAEFQERAKPYLTRGPASEAALAAMASEVQERVRTLTEVEPMIEFLVVDEPEIDEASWTKAITKGKAVAEMLDATIVRLDALGPDEWSPEPIQAAVSRAAVDAGLVNAEGHPQLSKAQGPVRVAISGRTVGPPLWESIAVLGRERTLARLRGTRGRLG
ncbi:MAG: glutamate--tRNA ligase [Acidimicrobiales bacterium]|nr:glutamate--tRNA ligase [Acidimicrobiales bacterium]